MKTLGNTLAERKIARWGRREGLAYAKRTRVLTAVCVGFAGLVPVGVGACDAHARMADGEDVYFVTDDFVLDAVGFDNQLAKKSMACLNLFGLIHNDSVCCFKEVA